MFSRQMLLADNSILVQVDQEFHEFPRANITRDRDLDPGNTRRTGPDGLSAVLALQERNHLMFQWFSKSDYPEAGVLAGEQRANQSRGLKGASAWEYCCRREHTFEISLGVRGSKGWRKGSMMVYCRVSLTRKKGWLYGASRIVDI